MIQLKRGSTQSWRRASTQLAPGQPGYDKNKHKIKIGDGEKSWSDLPYASGLFAEEILNSEQAAKEKYKADSEDKTIITYGEEAPNNETVGQLYLQHYEADPEVDYVVSSGIDGIWTYQLWKSGIAECWGTYTLTTNVQEPFDGVALFSDDFFANEQAKIINYPVVFTDIPTEVASVHGPHLCTWLANTKQNTASASGSYAIISPYPQSQNSMPYYIYLQVKGFWK